MSSSQLEAPGSGPRQAALAFLRLGILLAAGVVLAVVLHAVSVLIVVLALVAMVMIHELGHFVAAKASGMKVTEYFLGFGPRLWSVRKGETDYGVKALPAGGYVRITGMTMMEPVEPADEARSYRQASFPRRVAVAVAGSFMHMVMALVLCWSLFVFVGAHVGSRPYVVSLLQFAGRKSPAQLAGLHPGDEFVSMNGREVASVNALARRIGENAGKPLHIVVDRSGHLVHLTARPVPARSVKEYESGQLVSSKSRSGVIGVELESGRNRPVGVLSAVPKAFGEFGALVTTTASGIGQVFSLSGLDQFAHSVATAGHHHNRSSGSGSAANQPDITSILGVVQIGSQAAGNDPGLLLLLLADVNMFVGIVNLFPMLPLDGGHVAIAVYERIRSRHGRRYHADVLKLMPVAYLFLAFVVVLGLGALYANIVQPVHLPGG